MNAKSKCKAVKAKAKAKVAKKITKKCKACACALVGAALVGICGCGTNPAAYSVTQENKFENCRFIFGGASTNEAAVEMFTLAQNLENQGTQTATQPTTTDIAPDTDVTVGGASSGGKGLLESAVSALTSGSSSSDSASTATATTNTATCTDGSCSTCSDCTP